MEPLQSITTTPDKRDATAPKEGAIRDSLLSLLAVSAALGAAVVGRWVAAKTGSPELGEAAAQVTSEVATGAGTAAIQAVSGLGAGAAVTFVVTYIRKRRADTQAEAEALPSPL